jgi:uncharacterized repeat protein (TIGR03803 family)
VTPGITTAAAPSLRVGPIVWGATNVTGRSHAAGAALMIGLAAGAVPIAVRAVCVPGFTLSVVHEFPANYALTPKALRLGSDGNLYGTTSATLSTIGTVFRLAGGRDFTTVATFDFARDGGPSNAPFIGTNGLLTGITFDGGVGGGGTIYQIGRTGAITTLFAFNGVTGLFPTDLVQTPDGTLYGVTVQGGTHGAGNAYRLAPDGKFTNLVSCTVHTCYLPTALAIGSDGNVYGTAEGDKAGFLNSGEIFQVTPVFRTAFSFNGTRGNTPVSLLLANDGKLFGLTDDFFAGQQTFFRFSPPHKLTFLGSYQFPTVLIGGPVQAADGNFYGTLFGDIHHPGWVFQLTPEGDFRLVATFEGNDGEGPGAITPGADGALYGTTDHGGGTGGGVIFRMTLPGTRP